MNARTGLGAVAIVLGAVMVYALAGIANGIPHLLGAIGVLAMAAGALTVGMSGDRAV